MGRNDDKYALSVALLQQGLNNYSRAKKDERAEARLDRGEKREDKRLNLYERYMDNQDKINDLTIDLKTIELEVLQAKGTPEQIAAKEMELDDLQRRGELARTQRAEFDAAHMEDYFNLDMAKGRESIAASRRVGRGGGDTGIPDGVQFQLQQHESTIKYLDQMLQNYEPGTPEYDNVRAQYEQAIAAQQAFVQQVGQNYYNLPAPKQPTQQPGAAPEPPKQPAPRKFGVPKEDRANWGQGGFFKGTYGPGIEWLGEGLKNIFRKVAPVEDYVTSSGQPFDVGNMADDEISRVISQGLIKKKPLGPLGVDPSTGGFSPPMFMP